MGGSRTTKTLAALFVAMTLGALALMVLETEPVRPMAQPLAVVSPPPAGAAEVVYDTRADLAPSRWRFIVLHAAADGAAEVVPACHFVVSRARDGRWQVLATEHWRQQRPGRHIEGIWRQRSIGICLVGDFSQRGPEAGQLDTLVDLVNTLQEVCRLPAERVYLHSDLVARSDSPGRAFPAAAFSARLLRPQG